MISVLMPAYNAQQYLREAVASILNQTERDFELILVNDGSTDETHSIAQELSSVDSRIRYFSQDNRGVVAALNRGLELCKGDFIARMDADDVSHPRRLEQQLALLRANPDVIICGSDALVLGRAGSRIRKPRSDRACRACLLVFPCFVHPSVMFRRSVVDRGLRYRADFQYAEDYDLWVRIGELGKMRNIRQPLLSYRLHADQLTRTRQTPQQQVHTDISTRRLAEAGIVIGAQEFRDIFWPQHSARSRPRILLSACFLFLRMAVRGRFSLSLVLSTCLNILLHH